jgi:hypothetical protein
LRKRFLDGIECAANGGSDEGGDGTATGARLAMQAALGDEEDETRDGAARGAAHGYAMLLGRVPPQMAR